MKKLLLFVFALSTLSSYSTVYTVTNTAGNDWWPAEGAAGSLMKALYDANNHAGIDTIRFAINGGTTITTAKNPLIISDNGGLFIDGISTLNGTSVIFSGSFQITGNDVTTKSLNFNVSTFGSISSCFEIQGTRDTLKNCTITSSNKCLEFTSLATNNVVNNCSFSSTNHTLTITGSSNKVLNSTFSTSGASQNSIWINGGSGSTVDNCNFTASKVHAISVENGGSHNVSNCTITNISDNSIMLRGTGSNKITNCNISFSGINGIGILSNKNTIDNCNLFSNSSAGVIIDGASENTISNCKVYNNSYEGIGIQGASSNNIITSCEVYGNNKTFTMNGQSCNLPHPRQAGIKTNGTGDIIEKSYIYSNNGNGILAYDFGATEGTGNSNEGKNIIIRNNMIGTDLNSKTGIGNGWNGIFVWGASNCTCSGNTVVQNGYGSSHSTYLCSSKAFVMPDRISGIRFQEVTGGTILSNYIGTNSSKANMGNDFDGITMHTNTSNITVTGNIICNNGLTSNYGAGGGIANRENSDNNIFRGNFIGSHQDLTDGGNNDYGISFEDNCSGNTVGGAAVNQGNVIANSKNASGTGTGVWLVSANADNNVFYNNAIRNNANTGILIEKGASNNIIGASGQGNIISGNKIGISVRDNGTSSTNKNTLRFNSFSCNTAGGIKLTDSGNNLFGGIGAGKDVTVDLNQKKANFISGTAPANAIVDIYAPDNVCALNCSSDSSQGMVYSTFVTANALGFWEYDYSADTKGVNFSNAIVMASESGTAGQTNSSEFSVCSKTCTAPTNVTLNASSSSFCIGSSTTLTANSNNITVGGNYKFTFYKGSVAPANIIATQTNDSTLDVTEAGSYFVTVANTVDESICTMTSPSKAITMNALPVVSVNNNSICSGDPAATFTATTALPAVAASWKWSDKGTLTAQTTTGNTAGNYIVEVTDINGCKASATGTLTVKDLPVVSVSSSTPLLCITPGAKATLTGSPINGTWTGNGVGTSIDVTTGGTYTYTVTENGCVNSKDYTLAAENKPNFSIKNDTLCTGSNIVLDASGGVVGETYLWNTTPSQSSQTISVSSAGTYIVTVTGPLGCANKDTAVIAPSVVPSITSNKPVFCLFPGNTVDLTGSPTGNEVASWSWIGQASTNPLSVSAAGDYTFQVVFKNGCTETAIYTLNSESLPDVQINDATLCSNESEVILNASTGAADETYLWNTGSTNPTLSATIASTYTVDVTSKNGCVKNKSVIVNSAIAPTVNLGKDTTICSMKSEKYVVKLTHNGLAGGTYSWNSDVSTLDSIIVGITPTMVIGTYTDINTCSDNDTINITEYCYVPPVKVVTIFVPGGTENPSWTPFGGITPEDIIKGSSKLEVYDRWGLKMYESTEELPTWDGTYNKNPVVSGVYFWIWIYKDVALNQNNLNGFVQVIQPK